VPWKPGDKGDTTITVHLNQVNQDCAHRLVVIHTHAGDTFRRYLRADYRQGGIASTETTPLFLVNLAGNAADQEEAIYRFGIHQIIEDVGLDFSPISKRLPITRCVFMPSFAKQTELFRIIAQR
jgi:hypothetical protein